MGYFRNQKGKTAVLRYKQIFALFFTFFLVFALVSSLTYASMVARQRDRLKRQIEQCLRVDVNLMDQYIRRVHTAAYKFLSRTSVYAEIPPLGAYTAEDYRNVSALVEQLEELFPSVSDYADQMYFFSNSQHVLTPQGTYNFEAYFNRVYRHAYYTADYWKNTPPSGGFFESYPVDTVSHELDRALQVVPLVASWKKQNQQMTLVTEVSSTYVEKMMLDNLTLEGQSILCADRWGNALVNTLGEAFLPEELLSLNSRILPADEPLTLDELSIHGNSYCVCGMQAMNGMTYYIFTPTALLAHASYETNQYLLCIFLGTMVIFFLLTVFFSNKLFHPIQDILNGMEILKKDHSIAVKNWGLAESSLRRREEAVQACVGYHVALVCGNAAPVALDRLEQYFFQTTGLERRQLVCMVLQFSFQDSYVTDFSEPQREVIDSALPQALRALLSSRFQSFHLIRYGPGCFISFFNGDADTRKKLQSVLTNLSEVLQYDYRYCRIACGLSEMSAQEDGGFAEAVSQAFMALGRSRRSREGRDGDFSVVDFASETTQYRPVLIQNDISRLYNLMRSGKKEELYATLDDILQENARQNVHQDTMRLLVIRLYGVAVDYLLACNLEPDMVSGDYWARLQPEEDAQDPIEAVKHFLGHCMDITRSSASEDENINRILSYITGHYSEMLYLDLIAQKMDMNPKYLSRFFKTRVGISITEYISMVRISKAKELLTETHMKIEDIGAAVGFDNRTTFFRLFKKIEGMSPNRYRKDHL